MNNTKGTREFTEGKLERRVGVWKDRAQTVYRLFTLPL